MAESLTNKTKNQLIEIVKNLQTVTKQLQSENAALKVLQKIVKQNNDRLEQLERQQNLNIQYQRRDTIEITGIPSSIKQEELEEEVIKILDAGRWTSIRYRRAIGLVKKELQSANLLIGNTRKKACIVEKKLKDVEIYGENSRIYINNSFCDEFKYLNFLIRKAKGKEIVKWRIKRGINLIQVNEGEAFVENWI